MQWQGRSRVGAQQWEGQPFVCWLQSWPLVSSEEDAEQARASAQQQGGCCTDCFSSQDNEPSRGGGSCLLVPLCLLAPALNLVQSASLCPVCDCRAALWYPGQPPHPCCFPAGLYPSGSFLLRLCSSSSISPFLRLCSSSSFSSISPFSLRLCRGWCPVSLPLAPCTLPGR